MWVAGCAFPEAESGLNFARIAALLAGLPETVGGITINRYCSSGINAVQIAADRIRTGEAEAVIAAGSESMSMIPMMGNKVSLNPAIFAKEENLGIAYGMGLTAEKVAEQWNVSREDQDAFAIGKPQTRAWPPLKRANSKPKSARSRAGSTAAPNLAGREVKEIRKQVRHRRRPARRTPRSKAWPSCAPCLPPRQRHRRQFTRKCPTAPVPLRW